MAIFLPCRVSQCRRFGLFCALALGAIALVVLGRLTPGVAVDIPNSNYSLAQAQPFNQVANYPIQPLPTSANLRPNGQWLGRLILPSEQDYAAQPGDWAWFEVWHGAEGAPDLVGQTVRLTWKPSQANSLYVETVTRDIEFSQQAENFLANGNVVPIRLNGRRQVGPLQSLAGARLQDDVTVRLVDPGLTNQAGEMVLQTSLEPIQITGREYGLVKILGPDPTVNAPLPTECPGPQPCPTEFFQVQFYDTATGGFTGPRAPCRIPQQPML
ncbi:MAG: CPBP family intramembrane metalloprotease domain-containing protein, partial [Leptolyngbyaceae cyanobacterium SM2_5_2]|nr:CPBP family intramembrane metalloprotease domain-containing protein [Leptolyngbyaceae cyanobacterium SM2_5_2]